MSACGHRHPGNTKLHISDKTHAIQAYNTQVTSYIIMSNIIHYADLFECYIITLL